MNFVKTFPGYIEVSRRYWFFNACVTAAAIVLFAQLPANAGNSSDWINRVIVNKGNVNCAGERVLNVYENGKLTQSVTQTFSFKKGDKQYIEAIAPTSEEGSLIISNGVTLWEYSPHTHRVIERRLENKQMREQNKRKSVALIASGVDIIENGEATVAGRRAFVATLKSKCGQILRKYWIDTKTGVELRCDDYRDGNKPYTSTRVTSISFAPTYVAGMFDFIPPKGAVVTQAPKPTRRMALKNAEKLAGFDARLPSAVPPGYVLEGNNVAVTTYRGKITLWLTYTNGLDTFSLFQTKSSELSSQPCREQCAVQWCSHNLRFTLVGNLPTKCSDALVKSLQ